MLEAGEAKGGVAVVSNDRSSVWRTVSELSNRNPPAAGGEARGALAISLGQAALMLMGGVLALLITQFFGKGAGTDAFFTAYGFYVIAVAFAQTLRLTALPRLMADVIGDEESRLLAATAAMALLAAVPMLAFAGPLGGLIANGDPTGVAAQTLRLLWPALAMHLMAGVMVPMLTLRAIYTPVGLAYVLASFTSVIAFVLLQPELELKAVSVGLTFSAALLAASLALTLRRAGWRLRARQFTDLRSIARDCRILTVSSASFLIVNVGYLICLAVANHGERGSATTYAYAFFAAAFLVATTAIPSAMVRAPRLLDSGGDRGVAPGDVLADFRVALVLLIPAFGLAAVLVRPLVELVAGGFFASDDATRLVVVLMALAPWVLASVAGVLVVLERLNRRGSATLAWIALVHAVALVPLAIAGRLGAGLAGIALAQSLAMCAATGVQISATFGSDAATVLRRLTSAAAEALAVWTLAFAVPTLVVALVTSSAAAVIPLAAAGAAVYVAVSRRRYGREWELLMGIVRRRPAAGD